MYSAGDVVLVSVQFTDTFEIKTRPVLVLFSEFDNVVVAGITSNLVMKGISLSVADGAVKKSVIKTNYIFTITSVLIKKKLFSLSSKKRELVFNDLSSKLHVLVD